MTLHRQLYLLVKKFHLVIKDISGLKMGIRLTGLLSDLVLKDQVLCLRSDLFLHGRHRLYHLLFNLQRVEGVVKVIETCLGYMI
jgi:hypothetical protein